MLLWEGLESARRALFDSYRSGVQTWSEETISLLTQRFQSAAGTALEAVLEAATGPLKPWDRDTFEEQLRHRVLQTLADCQAKAVRALQTEVGALARNLGLEAGPALAAQWRRSQGAGTGQEDLGLLVAAALQTGGMRWEPPALGQPAPRVWDPQLPVSLMGLLLPGRWARRHTVNLIRARLPVAIQEASQPFGQIARDYWERCLASLDGALDIQVRQIRSNVERGALPGCLGTSQAATVCEGPGCVVCAQVWRVLYDFFTQFQQALASDAEVQGAFQATTGLCPSHLWLLGRFSSPRGLCAGLPGLMEHLASRLETLAQIGLGEAVLDPVPHLAHPGTCMACQTLEQATRDAVEQIRVDLLGTSEVLPDLCLQHLPLVLAQLERNQGAELAQRLAQRLVRVAQAMSGFSLKFDARRGDLLSEAERRAHREALAWLAGDRNLLGAG
jgi:hypothetical protein